MNKSPYYITAEELAAPGKSKIPPPLRSSEHLIYSSPAALSFNSPGAEGFGVKRAGLSVPGSVMLIVSPGCCGRNTQPAGRMPEYKNRFFYLNLEEGDIVTGKHLQKIPGAVKEIVDYLEVKPSVVMICITCVDALLGTDMESVCRKTQDLVSLPVRPCYMYALTREGSRPPMVYVRQSIYSLLKPAKRRADCANILGFFSPLMKSCELYDILSSAGISEVREVSACESYNEFLKMSEANFNLLLNPEGRLAAGDLSDRLGIPYIELARMYNIEQNRRQYDALSKALGIKADTGKYLAAALEAQAAFCNEYKGLRLAVGECFNGDAFEAAYALSLSGLCISEIYGTVTDENFVWIKHLAAVSPDTKIYSNLEPTMLFYEPDLSDAELAVGKDACWYHPDIPGISFNSDIQPFGFSGIISLYNEMSAAMKKRAA